MGCQPMGLLILIGLHSTPAASPGFLCESAVSCYPQLHRYKMPQQIGCREHGRNCARNKEDKDAKC
jgi:hypothetical protein